MLELELEIQQARMSVDALGTSTHLGRRSMGERRIISGSPGPVSVSGPLLICLVDAGCGGGMGMGLADRERGVSYDRHRT